MDRNLRFTTNQGVCGEAYRERGIKSANLTVKNPATYNLCKEQIEKTKDLKLVISCPIRKIDEDTLELTHKVIGVVNFDSKSVGSEKLESQKLNRDEIIKKIYSYSELCSRLF